MSNPRMFLRMVRCTGIYIESKIRLMIQQQPDNIFALVKQQRSRAECGTFGKFNFYPKYTEIFVINATNPIEF